MAFHNGFKISQFIGNEVKVETYTGDSWIFLFKEKSIGMAKCKIDSMKVICKSSVTSHLPKIYNGFRLTEWDGGTKVETLNSDWIFLFNAPNISSAIKSLDLMIPKGSTKLYNNFKIVKHTSDCVSVLSHNNHFLFNADSIKIAKKSIDVICKKEEEISLYCSSERLNKKKCQKKP